MTDHQQILDEEFEVLESIFPDELEKLSDRSVQIRVEPDNPSSSYPLTIHLIFTYPSIYPDVLPDMFFEPIDEDSGELSEPESEEVLTQLRIISLGMAMTFTIAAAAREALGEVVKGRQKRENDDYERRAREYEEAEANRTKGTPLTRETFDKWRQGFVSELKVKRDKEEDERLRALPAKEKEEYRRRRERLSGKQLFETSQTLATSDEALYEEGAAELDLAQYSREEREKARRREEEEEERRRRGLVDTGEESE